MKNIILFFCFLIIGSLLSFLLKVGDECITCADDPTIENFGFCVQGDRHNVCQAGGYTCDGWVVYNCPDQ